MIFFLTTVSYCESIIKAHGISNFGDLKYPPDFEALDYVNPTSPKGGEISTWAFGTFDSLNRYIIKGNAANSGNIFNLNILTISFISLASSSLFGTILNSY